MNPMDCEICASPKMVCYIHSPPTVDPTVGGWRCTCMVYVVPGEEHRCFYRDILAVLDRIAVQLEARPPPTSMTTTPIPPLDLMRFK